MLPTRRVQRAGSCIYGAVFYIYGGVVSYLWGVAVCFFRSSVPSLDEEVFVDDEDARMQRRLAGWPEDVCSPGSSAGSGAGAGAGFGAGGAGGGSTTTSERSTGVSSVCMAITAASLKSEYSLEGIAGDTLRTLIAKNAAASGGSAAASGGPGNASHTWEVIMGLSSGHRIREGPSLNTEVLVVVVVGGPSWSL